MKTKMNQPLEIHGGTDRIHNIIMTKSKYSAHWIKGGTQRYNINMTNLTFRIHLIKQDSTIKQLDLNIYNSGHTT